MFPVQALEDHPGADDVEYPFRTGDIIAVLGSRDLSNIWSNIEWEDEWEWKEYRYRRGENYKDYWWLGTHLKESSRLPDAFVFDPTYVERITREEAHAAISRNVKGLV